MKPTVRVGDALHRRAAGSIAAILAGIALALLHATAARAQMKAQIPAGPNTPVWDKGIQPIDRDSYWNAVECGKQGGARPVCVFWDADFCKNDDFTIAFFTPYKAVAYEVWRAVSQHQPAPTPDYGNAQRTRITLGVTLVKGSKNAITAVAVTRGERVVKPATQTIDESGGGRFIFDFAAFAPTGDITIDLVGRSRTRTCAVDRAVLTTLR